MQLRIVSPPIWSSFAIWHAHKYAFELLSLITIYICRIFMRSWPLLKLLSFCKQTFVCIFSFYNSLWIYTKSEWKIIKQVGNVENPSRREEWRSFKLYIIQYKCIATINMNLLINHYMSTIVFKYFSSQSFPIFVTNRNSIYI